MRLRWMNLPPLATHTLCVLGGTLLFQPASGPPEGDFIYVAWKSDAIMPKPAVHRRYKVLLQGKGDCLLSPRSFPVWVSPKEKSFLILPKSKEGFALLRSIQNRRPHELLLKEVEKAPSCSAGPIRYD